MMHRVGVFPGKFLPPHRGHLHSIIQAATQVDRLYVVLSDNQDNTIRECRENGLRLMPAKMRAKWLSVELQNLEHIQVLLLDETDLPPYPHGTEEWTKRLIGAVPERFTVIFGGDEEYRHTYQQAYGNDVEYITYDPERTKYPISATKVRSNPMEHWDYILGSARSHFAKRVLITGVESCGKTTLAKKLAKIYHTSWSEEYGRFYSDRFLGGNESLFTPEDFGRIAFYQAEQDQEALRTANKVVFIDTDAVVTLFYLEMYTGEVRNVQVESFIDPQKYDKVLFMQPNVPWVNDGKRTVSDDKERSRLASKLFGIYSHYGFNWHIVDSASYSHRLENATRIVDGLISSRA